LTSGVTWQSEQGTWGSATSTWETGDNAAALVEAVALAKPGGVRFQLFSTDGNIWSSATKTWGTEGSLTSLGPARDYTPDKLVARFSPRRCYQNRTDGRVGNEYAGARAWVVSHGMKSRLE
jgi:hypothetical protein